MDSKRRRRRWRKRKSNKKTIAKPSRAIIHHFGIKIIGFLASAGFLIYFVGFASEYVRGDVRVTYSESFGDATELILTNDAPVDRRIDRLRFRSVGGEIMVMNKDTVSIVQPDGSTVFPDFPSPLKKSPAEKFSELDGSTVPAKASIKFRLPPFSNSPLYSVRDGVVELTLISRPVFRPFAWSESLLSGLGLLRTGDRQRFLITGHHWTAVAPDYFKSTERAVCEDQLDQLVVDVRPGKPCSSVVKRSTIQWPPAPENTGDATAVECMSRPGVNLPFTVPTKSEYILAGKFGDIALREDGSGKPLISYVVLEPGTKVICDGGRIVLLRDGLEEVRYFWKKQ